MRDLEQLLADIDDMDCSLAAWDTLEREAVRSWLPRLYKVLATHPSAVTRWVVARPIARLDGAKALPELLRALPRVPEEMTDNDGLGQLISDVVSNDPAGAAPYIRRMLDGTDPFDREDAAWLWGFAAEVLPREPLLALLSDPSANVRSNAVGSLASYDGRPDVVDRLLSVLEDADEHVVCCAAQALGFLGDVRAAPRLRALAESASEEVRRFTDPALLMLERAGGDSRG